MKRSLYEILEHYIEERTNGNDLVVYQCHKWLSDQGKNSEEIDEILIEFDDEWNKEQMLEDAKKKGRQSIVFGSISFVVLSIAMIISALLGALSPLMLVFVGAPLFLMLKGASEIKDAKRRKERRAFKWENWK